MKKRHIYSFLLIGASLFASCTKNFDKINTDPNQTTSTLLDPNYLMSQSQINFANAGYDQLLFQSMWVQGLAGTEGYYTNGDKYVVGGSFDSYLGETWGECYGAGTLAYEIKNLAKGKTQYSNLDNCATILLVLYQQRVTDAYGDCPYSVAYQAKTGSVYAPAFDKQKDIYTAMLSQLVTATAALDPSKDKLISDLFYAGDISKWKRLGYSLMLRCAMRLTKVDPATAQKYAEMAYTGGTMTSVADDAIVYADGGNGNANADATTLKNNTPDWQQVRWSKTLIDYMQSSSDPRIPAVAEISAGTGLTANGAYVAGINTANLQIGMPNGYDLNSGATDISKAPGYPGATPADPTVKGDAPAPLAKYSRPRYAVYVDLSRANFLLTYGESELLLAEAATRGWAAGTATTHYANALTADMTELAQFNTSPQAVVAPADINAYVAAHPLNAATALQQINMEYFVETCTSFDFNEAWNNWKRSGYPALVPVVYPGQFTDGSIPRRIEYPTSLVGTDAAGYASAIADQGPDKFETRVWWDTKAVSN